jgi:hypothetical protein
MLPDWVRTRFTDVRSDDDLVRALGVLAKVRPGPLSAGMPVDPDSEATVLIDLADPADLDAIATQWLAPLDAAIGTRTIAAVELWFAGGERYRYRHRHRWRLWRRLPRDASS